LEWEYSQSKACRAAQAPELGRHANSILPSPRFDHQAEPAKRASARHILEVVRPKVIQPGME
jgi:hypothetical protein